MKASEFGLPRPPSLHNVRERIAALRRISLETAEVDNLVKKLTLLFRGYTLRSPVIDAGQHYYRGVTWDQRPLNVTQLTYPPAEYIRNYGRANEPGQSIFYASLGREATLYELRSRPGDHVAISRWRLVQRAILNNVGFTAGVMQRLRSNRGTEGALYQDDLLTGRAANKLVHEFLADEFTRSVQPGREHEYKISAAISRKLLGKITEISADLPQQVRFDGILYPALAVRGNADNVALLPDFVDRYLVLEWVEYVRVDTAQEEEFRITVLDFANSFTPDGAIEWRGRLPQWTISEPGTTYVARVKGGQWILEDETGRRIEPS